MIRKNPEILDALQQLKRPHSDGEETSDDENADLDVEDASVRFGNSNSSKKINLSN